MFNIFKRNKKIKASDDDIYDINENNKSNIAADSAKAHAFSQSLKVSAEKAAEKYAKPSQYSGNRYLYDDSMAKIRAKTDTFKNNSSVRDPYTGNKLELTAAEAQLKYGENWQKHLAESDHIHPIERAYNEAKNNPWLTNEDIKNAANSSENIRVVSREFNNAKRSRTNSELVNDSDYLASKGISLTEEGRERALRDETEAINAINRAERNLARKNVLSTAHEAGLQTAKSADSMTAAVSATTNIVDVIKGDKTPEEAIEDIIEEGGSAAVTGYFVGNGVTTITQTLSYSSSEFLSGLAKANVPVKIVTAVTATGNILGRYCNGEITTQECILELGESGMNYATIGYAMAMGQSIIPIPIIGAAVGAFAGSVLTGQFCDKIFANLRRKEAEHLERQRLIKAYEAAAEEQRAYRAELEEYLDGYFKKYRQCFDNALYDIQKGFKENDPDGVIRGANSITKSLGGKVQYESVEEFDRFLKSGEAFEL